jgi:GMP synthase (glutamine-hydrolysing)
MAFDAKKFIVQAEKDIRMKMGKDHAITAVSGGVDSFVAATLAARAVPGQLHIVYVDNGLMRRMRLRK